MPVAGGNGGARFRDDLLSSVGVPELQPPLSTGSVIGGKYRLERLLGEGGMGAVWRAQHLQLDLPVAIKLLRAGSEETNLPERLKIEARAAAQLTHPAIVRVFDVDTTDTGEPYIVMELLSGQSLAEMLERGRLSPVNAVQILLPIADALAQAHGKGIVHRDLKPHNVFMVDDGDRLQPKLLDFGIAKLTMGPLDGSLTDTGMPVGSPDYMSPEQARGSKDVDFRADIWAFCVVLYEALRGDVPFHGDNYNALMRSIVELEPEPLRIEGDIDERLADLIIWGLAKERDQRPSSILELGRELARWLLDRNVDEDVCGTPLGPKWITRTAQKSIPLIVKSESAPTPVPAVSTETLVSPRLPNVSRSARSKRAAAVSLPEQSRRRGWLVGAAVTALVAMAAAGLAWSLTGSSERSPRPGAALSVALPAPPVSLVAPPIASVSPLASSPPTPVRDLGKLDRGNPAPTSSLVKTPPRAATGPKNDGGSSKAKPAAKPAPDVHDEARELLQAY